MPDLVLICLVISMNQIQRPAWICFRYVEPAKKPEERQEYKSLVYHEDQRFQEKTAAKKDPNSIFWLGMYCLMVLVIDILWLVFYFGKYWNSAYVDNAEQKFVRCWCVIVSCALPICNAVLLVCLYMSGKQAPEFKKGPVLRM